MTPASDIMAQINQSNFTIDPNWVMIVMGGIISFFVIRTLTKMEKMLEKHEEAIEELKSNHLVHVERIDKLEEQYPHRVAEVILAKLKTMNG